MYLIRNVENAVVLDTRAGANVELQTRQNAKRFHEQRKFYRGCHDRNLHQFIYRSALQLRRCL
jgi:hypothetical protein